MRKAGLLFWLFKRGFKVSSGNNSFVKWHRSSYGADLDTSEIAGSESGRAGNRRTPPSSARGRPKARTDGSCTNAVSQGGLYLRTCVMELQAAAGKSQHPLRAAVPPAIVIKESTHSEAAKPLNYPKLRQVHSRDLAKLQGLLAKLSDLQPPPEVASDRRGLVLDAGKVFVEGIARSDA